MGLAVCLVNRLLILLYKKSAKEFYDNMHNADKIQEDILLSIIEKNKNTDYGKKYGFDTIKTIREYREKVPITSYLDYKSYIEEIAKGKENVLTEEKVNMFELTGGSGGAVKLIPYTVGLKDEFLNGIKPWLYSLYQSFPTVRNGKSYWSITPPTHEKQYTEGGIPIGFEDDSAYFGKIEQFLTDIIFVRDKKAKDEKDMDKFYFRTCLALLKEKNLSLISVWNPSYLKILLNFMNENEQNLLNSLSKRRQKEVANHIKERRYDKIWQKLAVISCWCDGNAISGSEEIKNLFKGVHIQPKGLLSTEAFMTLPHEDNELSILSYRSHYFEFLDVNTGEIYNLAELEKGCKYEIIFTTSGGFYRYRINDAVIVEDYDNKNMVPLFRFIGKTDKTSDFHGEKLNEIFVKEVFDRLSSDEKIENIYSLKNRFKLMAYEDSRYILFLENHENDDFTPFKELASKIDNMLCDNYHYKLCRDLKQLNAVEIYVVYGDAKQDYLNFYLKKGKKLGDIKPELLSLHSGWTDAFLLEETT